MEEVGHMKLNYALTLALALLVGILGTLLVTQSARQTESGVAWGQESGQAGPMIGLIGDQGPLTRSPVILVDTARQVIMAYEYNVAERRLYLTQVRNYRADNQLTDYPPGSSRPTIADIQNYLNQQGVR